MTLPLDATWLDAEAVGMMLGYKTRIVRERIACLPGFPVPARINGRGLPRWNAAEVDAWMRAQRELNPAAPLRPTSTERSTSEAES
jgi:predicted DNA-binding transcriptional regulator AlpA